MKKGEADMVEIMRLHHENVSIKAIASRFGTTPTSIRKWICDEVNSVNSDLGSIPSVKVDEKLGKGPVDEKKLKKFYIASRLENVDMVTRVANVLTAAGYIHSYDWTVHGSVQNEGEERITEVACAEYRGVFNADIMIVLLPGGRGTHTELGIALQRMPIVICSETDELLLQDERTCAFYWMPGVHRVVGTIDIWLAEIFRLACSIQNS